MVCWTSALPAAEVFCQDRTFRSYGEIRARVFRKWWWQVCLLLSSIAGGIGLAGGEGAGLIVASISALLGWVIWAVLIYVLGTKVFAQPQTSADVGELLRTTGFAAAPGVLRVLGAIPGLGVLILVAVSIWMLVAMVIAVRQALDFTSTWRAVAVCVAGWLVTLVMIAVIGGFMAPLQ
jgi:hypothetical protein